MAEVSRVLADRMSRRGFIGRVGAAMLGVMGAAGAQYGRPDAAAAHHICGHTGSTGGCPHPTGLPRVDANGRPLRAKDGRPVDDLGRLIDPRGRPVAEDGRLLRDYRGLPLRPAPRSRVCLDAVARRYGLPVYQDGSWFRCCGGRVRKIVDCCGATPRRINGDASVVGYCKAGRRVFCVQYLDTDIPC